MSIRLVIFILLHVIGSLKASEIPFFDTFNIEGDLPFIHDIERDLLSRIVQEPTLLVQVRPQDRSILLAKLTIKQIVDMYTRAKSCVITQSILENYAQSFNMLILANEELSEGFLEQASNLYTRVRHLVITHTTQPIISNTVATALVRYFSQITNLDISRNEVDEATMATLRSLRWLETLSFSCRSADFTIEGWTVIKSWDIKGLDERKRKTTHDD